jgi:serine/threonine-protein kinase
MAETTSNLKGLVGEILGDGRYDLRELLGGGSMGHVYRALDRRLETNVVVKIPHRARLESSEFLKRFRQESRFLVKLIHPHVVSIIDLGEHEGVPFFVMPFIGGGNQRNRQRNESGMSIPLPPESLHGWLGEIAKALDFIHARDCIHRDVKPDNILFDSEGHPFLSDFGLSKLLKSPESGDQSHTVAGAIVGTPLYVAPELVLGEAFDGRADQYSLAVTVYESLTGSNPFEGPNSSATMVNHTSRKVPSLTGRVPFVSEQTSLAILKGLAKSPEERFATCVEFADEVLAGINRPTSGRSSSASARRASPEARSSDSNALEGDTDPCRVAPGKEKRRSSVPTRSVTEKDDGGGASKTRPSSPGVPVPAKPLYRATKRRPIVKGQSQCPDCEKDFALRPAFAGKVATCKGCECRLQIAPDFSEIRKLEPVPVAAESANPSLRSNVSTTVEPHNEFDLVLGQDVFGWKLNRNVVLGLGAALILFLMLMTMFLTNRAARIERDREKQQEIQRHRTIEEG